MGAKPMRAPMRGRGKRSLDARRLVAAAALAFALGPGQARPQEPAADGALPEPLRAALHATGVPAGAIAVVVRPLGGGALRLALNDGVPMSPASTMKLLTTYAALELLGPAHTWRTEVFADGALRRDVLDGDLVFRGSGDPKLVAEHLWLLVQRVRAYGVREIRGDVVLERTAFDAGPHDPARFDGEPLRPYNVGPDPLLINYKAVTFAFVPDPDAGAARVLVTPALAGLRVAPFVATADGPCNDWRARLQADFSKPLEPVFRGAYPAACGERAWHVSVLDHPAYFAAVFRALWEGTGGAWKGRVRAGTAPPDARRIARHESAPLAELIRDINRYSNNVMARQVFLALGTEGGARPGTLERSAEAVRSWLARRGMPMPELVLDNGSGLSRTERISAASLARLLAEAFDGPLMPEFVASLAMAGADASGRPPTPGTAHVKSGMLTDVRSVAGYVRAASGQRYIVVVFVNHALAMNAQPFLDLVLDWVGRSG
jgi:D-alanyl-D-alanine carboxypeptidase/D-alanyl-D-alanine-endopeptidase (penicillin-binding protein 4)